jgi:hypothetical protein
MMMRMPRVTKARPPTPKIIEYTMLGLVAVLYVTMAPMRMRSNAMNFSATMNPVDSSPSRLNTNTAQIEEYMGSDVLF